MTIKYFFRERIFVLHDVEKLQPYLLFSITFVSNICQKVYLSVFSLVHYHEKRPQIRFSHHRVEKSYYYSCEYLN